jgi:hypothetical protein
VRFWQLEPKQVGYKTEFFFFFFFSSSFFFFFWVGMGCEFQLREKGSRENQVNHYSDERWARNGIKEKRNLRKKTKKKKREERKIDCALINENRAISYPRLLHLK